MRRYIRSRIQLAKESPTDNVAPREEAAAEPLQKYLSPKEVAAALGVSADVVRGQFRRLPGVLIIGDRKRRRIRIPETVLKEWISRHSVK